MNGAVTAMDENGEEIKSPIKRLGSTRKLLLFNNIRLQLNEQLRCLDIRMESQVSLIQELQDFFRRRGEVELDYSKSLDKLAKSLQLRHKEQKQKREQWPMFSSYACWQQLVNQTKSLSKDHAALSEIYSTHLVTRLQTVIDDVQRIYKKCREIGYETHEEILRVLQELHTTMKTYHSYQNECKAAETKLRTAENQRAKLQLTIPKEKLERSKKYRLIEKEMLKRKNKYSDSRLKALKAKNEYQLCLEASNTTIHKYFVEDLSDLIDCMDLGFHSMVSRALLMHVTADQGRCRAVLHNSESLSHTVHSMDSRADKQKFLEQYHGAFMIPKHLEFQGQLVDANPIEPELQKALHSEMEARLQHLGQRVSNLRTESEEIWKTLETAEINLLDILNTKDYDSSSHFGDSTTQSAKPESLIVKLRADKQETEEFYINKIREYILGTSRIARLDSKAELLRTALEKDSALQCNTLIKSNVPKRKRIGRMNMTGQPKLFAGSLEEYLEVTGEEIPLIMRSCIRVINLYGLHHQGIFRVSGSQVEISNFREGFERGEDPLADTTDASDINSVAGVLKLYLRELREPLFPIIYFDHFVTLAQIESKHDLVYGIRKFLQSLTRPVVIVIRYLFAFLNHLSEFSDENMMDAYNLAICFGPTLMPAPEDKDQVQYQNQVNELIKNMIVYHEELFAKDLGGMIYEKYISPFDCEVGDSPTDPITEDPDSEVCPSEDESDTMEATAQFDFNARSNRELSLRKGDHVLLRKQVSNDWWQGTVKGKDGLVPDKYISLKMKDEERDKSSDHLKSSSSEESVRKRRPSGNLSTNNQQLSIYSQQTASSNPSTTGTTESVVTLTTTQTTTTINDSTNNVLLQKQQTSQQQQQQQQQQHQSQSQQAQSQPINAILMEKIDLKTIGGTTTTTTTETINIIPTNRIIDKEFHYDSVDNNVSNSKYSYHDEPHSFENSMEFLEDYNHFQYETRKLSEPIYAEPSKVSNPSIGSSAIATTSSSAAAAASSSKINATYKNQQDDDTTTNIHFKEYEGVTLRNATDTKSELLENDNLNNNNNNNNNNKINHTQSNISDDCYENNDNNNIISRHSDTEYFKEIAHRTQSNENNNVINSDNNYRPTRKFHSKSFSLSENRIVSGGSTGGGGGGGAPSNLFHQNRDLWEKRTHEIQHSQQQLSTPRILTRNRIAPDLVKDLPFPVVKDHPTNHNHSSSRDSLTETELEDMTSGERFATQNQCTLKKNERYSNGSVGSTGSGSAVTSATTNNNNNNNNNNGEIYDIKKEVKLDFKEIDHKPKAEVKPQENILIKELNDTIAPKIITVLDEILHIKEEADDDDDGDDDDGDGNVNVDNNDKNLIDTAVVLQPPPQQQQLQQEQLQVQNQQIKELHKSPIPLRNTQKFVSKFADLHLTGGCLSVTSDSTSLTTTTTTTICGSSNSSGSSTNICQATTLSSFKPQVKVKPQLMRKPLVLPPTTPEMGRRGNHEM